VKALNCVSEVPRVVIIVSSFNRATLLHDALRSLAPLLCAPEIAFSIVVFDAALPTAA
jgi:hypothetical protein